MCEEDENSEKESGKERERKRERSVILATREKKSSSIDHPK